MIRRSVIFALIFAILHAAWLARWASDLHDLSINRGVVLPAVALIRNLTPQLEILVLGNRMWESQGGVNIVNGCDGTEIMFLLIAAFALAPIRWRWRALGMLATLPVAYGLNQARILALFYAHHPDPVLFDRMHGSITPLFLVLSCTAFCHLWVRRFGPQGELRPA